MAYKSAVPVLMRPVVTEKSDRLTKKSQQYTLRAALNASKGDIRQAVEQIFKVKVLKVRTMVMRGKLKRMGRSQGFKPDWKKAVVTLAKGSELHWEKV